MRYNLDGLIKPFGPGHVPEDEEVHHHYHDTVVEWKYINFKPTYDGSGHVTIQPMSSIATSVMCSSCGDIKQMGEN